MAGFMDRYKTDKSLEEEGVWVDYGDGLQVQVRRLNSKHSKETRRKLEKPYSGQFRGRDLPEAVQEDLLNKQIANSIVTDWKGVPDPDNEDKMLECTPDNVLRMVSEFNDFRDDILTAAMERTTFQKTDLEVQEKNSKKSSSGS